jgi:FkbM family methyltransferase
MHRDTERLLAALQHMGSHPESREHLLAALRQIETTIAYDGPIRDDITGPIADAMFSENTVLRKPLSSGIALEFLYRSKIAREFVLSRPAVPDHAWEPQTTRLLTLLAQTASVAIIGGAYFGDQATIVGKTMAAHGGICHAFEPNENQADMLRSNARLNSLENVVTNTVALWRISGARLQFAGDDALAATEASEDDGHSTIVTTTIDDYVAERDIKAVGFIMLDIEGGELDALRGAARQLSLPADQAPTVVFEIHSAYVDWSNGLARTDIAEMLASFGYQMFAVRDYQGNVAMNDGPIELIPLEFVYTDGPRHGFNVLAVKDATLIDRPEFRVRTSRVSPKLLLHKDPALHQPLAD